MEKYKVLLNHQCFEIPCKKKLDTFELCHEKMQKNLIIYHEHDYCELYFVRKGGLKYYADGKEYLLKENDIFILDSGILHQQLIDNFNELDRVIIWINKDYLNSLNKGTSYIWKALESCSNIHIQNINDNNREIFSTLTKLVNNKDQLQKEALFLNLILLISNKLNTNNRNNEQSKLKDEKIISIINYINNNINSDISIDSLAVNFYVSKFYLMRKFSEEVGCSIHKYITEQRIALAKKLLNDGYYIDKVYSEVGYKDYSTFFKAFKKTVGVSPGKYNEANRCPPPQ